MEEEPRQPEAEPRPGRRARIILTVVAIALVGVVGALAWRSTAPLDAGRAGTDPQATLDEALTAGKPIYVLVHSAT